MNDTLKNELWEALIKTAVIQYTYEENSSIPTEKQLETIELPANYERNLNNFVKKFAKHEKRKSLLFYGKKIASIILIIIGITFVSLLCFEDVRAACKNVIITFYEKYIQFDYTNDNDTRLGNLSPQYIPEGFELIQSYSDEWELYIEYKNESNETIEILCLIEEQSLHLDNEHYIVEQVIINDFDGLFFDSQDDQRTNHLTWSTIDGYFIISSSLDFDIMKKIAENLN